MKKIDFVFAIIFLCTLISTLTNAQETNNKSWGISAAIQESQLDFLFPIWVSSNIVMAPGIGLIDIGGAGTDLRFGLVDRIYLNTDENIQPFLGGRGGILLSITEDEDNTIIDYVFGLLGGGEYFFSNNFSVGIEAQLNFSISDNKSNRFGNPGGTNINTASVIFATIYF
jgi:hypothetical protein